MKAFFSKEKTNLDKILEQVEAQMLTLEPSSEEYSKAMDKLVRLTAIKSDMRKDPVSRDTLIIVGGNILLSLIIVAYENKHVLSSKAFGQIIRTGPLQIDH